MISAFSMLERHLLVSNMIRLYFSFYNIIIIKECANMDPFFLSPAVVLYPSSPSLKIPLLDTAHVKYCQELPNDECPSAAGLQYTKLYQVLSGWGTVLSCCRGNPTDVYIQSVYSGNSVKILVLMDISSMPLTIFYFIIA